MKIMARPPSFPSCQGKIASETEIHRLLPAEIRLIADARTEDLARFSASSRLHAVDRRGDTPLHIAARMGNLALCDLFIRAGADPRARNHERQIPADVASAEGHLLAAQLLFSLVGRSQVDTQRQPLADVPQGDVKVEEEQQAAPSPTSEPAPLQPTEDQIELDDLLIFEPEEDPERFFDRSAGELASGTFVALVTNSPTDSTETHVDWEVDLSPVQIEGDGIGSEAAIIFDLGEDHDFLKVRNRGRRSAKRAVVPTGTRLSIDPDICLIWAAEILEKGWFTFDDIDTLISFCEGNGELDELRFKLLRTLEAAGLQSFDGADECGDVLWDIRSNVSADDLAEALEAALSRATRLPGTRRFNMDKSHEAQLLGPVVRAKQELQLGILACAPAVETILSTIDKLFDGSVEPGFVTMRTIVPSQRDHPETAAFFKAGQTVRKWNSTGRVMDGRRRREALEGLEALDLSLMFHKALVESLAEHEPYLDAPLRLDGLISVYEMAIDRLILKHLPYARRFAARNVEDGEDPEDVFQVAFMGLQRSSRRFDPERGHRFVVYSTFWMKQAVTRWRADEGAIIRIPVHRHEKLADLNQAVERLDARHGRSPTEAELVTELGWDEEDVEGFMGIPRYCSDLDGFEEWEGAISKPEQEDALLQTETARIVSEVLAELPERQAGVIRMRFGIGRDDEMTLDEIGQTYGVTRERIRQIEAKGLRRLSHPGRKHRMQDLLGI